MEVKDPSWKAAVDLFGVFSCNKCQHSYKKCSLVREEEKDFLRL